MTLDITIPFSLSRGSVARILLDSESPTIGATFGTSVLSMCRIYDNTPFIEERVHYHLSRYGRLGVPTDLLLSTRFKITQEELESALSLLDEHLKTLGI